MTPEEERLATAVEVALIGPTRVLARRLTAADSRLITQKGKSGWFAVLSLHGLRKWRAQIEYEAQLWAMAQGGAKRTIVEFLKQVRMFG